MRYIFSAIPELESLQPKERKKLIKLGKRKVNCHWTIWAWMFGTEGILLICMYITGYIWGGKVAIALFLLPLMACGAFMKYTEGRLMRPFVLQELERRNLRDVESNQ